MSGVWVFKQGVTRLVDPENPESKSTETDGSCRKVLVYVPSNEVITSYNVLERHLQSLGWERYYDDPHLVQFHKRTSIELISLPNDFNKFKSMHMNNIVVNNPNCFEDELTKTKLTIRRKLLEESPPDDHNSPLGSEQHKTFATRRDEVTIDVIAMAFPR
ncbi:hypothetical protein ACFE04_027526 [Oxalis oulophora]